MVFITDENGGVRFCLKLTEQKPPGIDNLFEESTFIRPFMYVSLGVLAGLLLIGTLWDIIRKKRRINQNTTLGEDKHFVVTLKGDSNPVSQFSRLSISKGFIINSEARE